MKRTIDVDLPWPPRGLSPNARMNRLAKAQLFKRTKMAAFIATAAALKGRPAAVQSATTVNVKLICTPPVLRYRDEDNLLANCKATLDGIAQKLGVDDHWFHFLEQEWHEPEAPGRLVVRLDWEE